jgi:hypothetical protein
MKIVDAYAELEQQLVLGKKLRDELDPNVGLTFRHLEWGAYCKTIIRQLDPHGEIFVKSSPVGMFYDPWNLATFEWPNRDETRRKQLTVEGFAQAVGALRAIVKLRPAPHVPSKPA